MSIRLGRRLLLATTQGPPRTQLRVSFQTPYEYHPSLSRPGRGCQFHSSSVWRDRSFTNFLADDTPPAVQVESISDNGIQLADGLIIPGPCIFLEGKVFLWDAPNLDISSRTAEERWKDWNEKRFYLFEVVTPRPGKWTFLVRTVINEFRHCWIEILVLGTGRTLIQPTTAVRECLRRLGIQLEVMDTVGVFWPLLEFSSFLK